MACPTRHPKPFILLAAAALLAFAESLGAQTVVNPRIVEFSPSADHNTTLPGGQPAVSRYDLEIYQAGASAPFQTTSMGKPSPATDGLVHYDFSGQVVGWPLPGGTYEMRATAVGPNGSGRSNASNPFTLSQYAFCTWAWSTASANVPATAGNGTVTLNTQAGCPWTASSSQSWLTITPASGNATATVTYSFAANPSSSPRTATITAAGQTFTVTQAGATCTITLSPTAASVPATAGSGTFALTAPTGCTWSASSNQGWLTVSPANGSGNGTVTFSYTANAAGTSRSATVTAGGQTFTVTQAGVTCTITLSATSQSVPASAGSGSVGVTSPTGCAWTASSSATWLTVTTTSGSGNGTVNFSYTANTSSSSRSATVTIGGQTLTVTQQGVPCTYSLSATAADLPSTGGTGSFTLTAQTGCTWTTSSDASWLTASPGSGNGNATIGFTATANTGSAIRVGRITVGGQTFTVTEAGGAPAAPTNVRVTSTGP
jgi:hypothetical protein